MMGASVYRICNVCVLDTVSGISEVSNNFDYLQGFVTCGSDFPTPPGTALGPHLSCFWLVRSRLIFWISL